MLPDYVRAFVERQTKKVEDIKEEMGKGQCTDWADYLKRVGDIRGRRAAILCATDLVTERAKDEDDEK